MEANTISSLKNDCKNHRRGRKAWWATKLGIPPLTLSHWLSGRQNPNGQHSLAIHEILSSIEQEKKCSLWEDYLWETYYSHQNVPDKILPLIIFEILSSQTLKVRTAALLIRLLKNQKPRFEIPISPPLQNRLGWLLSAAEINVPFSPNIKTKIQNL